MKRNAQRQYGVASKRGISVSAFSNVCVLTGLGVFSVGLVLVTVAAAPSRTRSQMRIRNLDAQIYPAGVTPTPTPCAGSWLERAPYPIAVSGHAVVSQGDNVYSFGGIVNNAAITTAYKYTPGTNTWTPIAPLPAPRGWFSGVSDGTYLPARRRGPKLQHDSYAVAL